MEVRERTQKEYYVELSGPGVDLYKVVEADSPNEALAIVVQAEWGRTAHFRRRTGAFYLGDVWRGTPASPGSANRVVVNVRAEVESV